MNLTLNSIYKKLYDYFGPQYWWPGQTPFEVMVGAILTQNTNWLNVEKAIANLKRYNLLAPDKLYKLSHRRLALLIRPTGYYNIKAKRLKSFLKFFVNHYQSDLRNMSAQDTASLRRQLLSIKGIGPETADSILLYALGRPVFVVDAYTKRILLRHRFIREDSSYEEVQNLFTPHLWTHSRATKTEYSKGAGFMQNLKTGVKLFNEYHALLVKLGKEFCLKNKPKCEICPLQQKKPIVHSP